MVGREEHGFPALGEKTGALAFDQVLDEPVVAAVPLQCHHARPLEQLRFRAPLEAEQPVAGLVVGFRRHRRVLPEHPAYHFAEQW